MSRETDVHSWTVPTEGDNDYQELFQNLFDFLDRSVEVRDVDANRGDYTPRDDAKFVATDTKKIYLGDGGAWNEFADLSAGSDGSGGSTTEEIQDIVGGFVTGADKVTKNYDDTNDELIISTTALDTQETRDEVNSILSAGGNISLTPNDDNSTISISATDTQLSDSEVVTVINNDSNHGLNASHTQLELTQVTESIVTSNTGSNYTIDVSQGTVFDLTLDDNTTISFTGAESLSGSSFCTVHLTQDETGGRSVSFSDTINWDSGTPPSIDTSPGTTEKFAFYSLNDNSTWTGIYRTGVGEERVAATGSTTLSGGGPTTTDTGVSTNVSNYYDVRFNPTADIVASLDGSGPTYKIHFEEGSQTSVGNPTVNWQFVEV